MINPSHCAAVFIATYFVAYFLRAWLFPNVPAQFRNAESFVNPGALLLMGFLFRALLATAMTLAYALWSTP
jgi:hypothetical protein